VNDWVTVNLSWVGTATRGTDYAAPTAGVNFTRGASTLILINGGPTYNDSSVEGPETVTLGLATLQETCRPKV